MKAMYSNHRVFYLSGYSFLEFPADSIVSDSTSAVVANSIVSDSTSAVVANSIVSDSTSVVSANSIIGDSTDSIMTTSTTTIDKLHPELMEDIFSHYIESEGHMKFLKNVAPVCRYWRNVSSAPSLWKNIEVRNWNYVLSLSERKLLYHTQSLKIPPCQNLDITDCDPDLFMRTFSEPQDRLAVLSEMWHRTDETHVTYRNPFPRQFSLDHIHVSTVLSSIRELKSLDISTATIDTNTMMVLAKYCPNLENLRMKDVGFGATGPMTLEALDPILTSCGPKLKQLHVIGCKLGDSEQLITGIAAKCPSLEVFEWCNGYHKFPIYKLVSGCLRLQKVILAGFEVVTTGENDCVGFEDLIVFKAFNCICNGLDLSSLLKNSKNLQHLELEFIEDFVFSDVSKIPSNKVTFLNITPSNMHFSSELLEQAVDKWKHTLLYLTMCKWECDITSVLWILLHSNPCSKLEVLRMEKESVDPSTLKIFLQHCQNLKECVFENPREHYGNREEVMELIELL